MFTLDLDLLKITSTATKRYFISIMKFAMAVKLTTEIGSCEETSLSVGTGGRRKGVGRIVAENGGTAIDHRFHVVFAGHFLLHPLRG